MVVEKLLGSSYVVNVSLNMNVHESGAWGVGASIHQGGKAPNGSYYKDGLALNVGYRETADGKVGLSAGFGINGGQGLGTANSLSHYMGLTTDTLLGNGVSLGVSGRSDSQRNILDNFNGSVGWSSGGGFQSSLEMEFKGEQLKNWLLGNGSYSNEMVAALQKFEEENRGKTALEKADLKQLLGLPMTKAEADAYEAREKQREGNKNQGADVLRGVGRAFNEEELSHLKEEISELEKYLKEGDLIASDDINIVINILESKKRAAAQLQVKNAREKIGRGESGDIKDNFGNTISYSPDGTNARVEINNVLLEDGDVIHRDTDGIMKIIKQKDVQKYFESKGLSKAIISGNGMNTNAMGTVDFLYDTMNILKDGDVMGVDVFQVYNATGKKYGLAEDMTNYVAEAIGIRVEPAVDTYSQILRSGALSKGGAVFVHSQGGDLFTQALMDYNQSIGANVFFAGGANWEIPPIELFSNGARPIGFDNLDPIPNTLSGIVGKKGIKEYSSNIGRLLYAAPVLSIRTLFGGTTSDPLAANSFNRALLTDQQRENLAPSTMDPLDAHSYGRSYRPFFRMYRKTTGRNLLNNY